MTAVAPSRVVSIARTPWIVGEDATRAGDVDPQGRDSPSPLSDGIGDPGGG